MLLPPPARDINRFLEQAIQLAAGSVADGGGPFGALVVTADGRVHEGVNRVARDNDPTAHAEVVAIRTAAASSATFDLSGAVLYASCEPCPLCLAAALWARVGRSISPRTVTRPLPPASTTRFSTSISRGPGRS
jgi:guanine deaminase